MTHWMHRVRVFPRGWLGGYPIVFIDKVYSPWLNTTGQAFSCGRRPGLVDCLVNSAKNQYASHNY